MHKHIMEKWVAELRSGNYEQNAGNLRTGDGFCCLGVLCDIHQRENEGWVWETASWGDGAKAYRQPKDYMNDPAVTTLPVPVHEWAGTQSVSPSVPIGSFDEAEDEVRSLVKKLALTRTEGIIGLADLNDGGMCFDGLNFEQIADVIEQNYPTL